MVERSFTCIQEVLMKQSVQAALAVPSFVLIAIASTAKAGPPPPLVCYACADECNDDLIDACDRDCYGYPVNGCFEDVYNYCLNPGENAIVACEEPE